MRDRGLRARREQRAEAVAPPQALSGEPVGEAVRGGPEVVEAEVLRGVRPVEVDQCQRIAGGVPVAIVGADDVALRDRPAEACDEVGMVSARCSIGTLRSRIVPAGNGSRDGAGHPSDVRNARSPIFRRQAGGGPPGAACLAARDRL
ncbi:hypothetical protein QA634_12800 [Methylobacterium sp. CB376]|uniref:hypothetical protein n=1 Tax=Methylobacterium sp. CB376 TaxID=3138063 RepID=UPI00223FA142|nr:MULTISPECIES: hypothetical protein [Methylobacterium]WFT82661.1 hypothetical protein QA634_12800 [Methylobacterium nodulans]